MRKGPSSSVNSKDKDRFWAHIAMMAIIATILIFAVFVWIFIQARTELLENTSRPASAPSNAPAAIIWSAGTNSSTNILMSF